MKELTIVTNYPKEVIPEKDLRLSLELNGFDLTKEDTLKIETLIINNKLCIRYQQED